MKCKEILLIEDQMELREILRENLESSGFKVWQAMDGQQGLDLIREGCRPDVVVSDILLPKRMGLEVLAEIRKLQPDIKLVAMTGSIMTNAGQSYRDYAQSLGADAVLQKPFGMEELEATISSLVYF